MLINGSLEALVSLDLGKSFNLKHCSSFRTPLSLAPRLSPQNSPGSDARHGRAPGTALASPHQDLRQRLSISVFLLSLPSGGFTSAVTEEREIPAAEPPAAAAEQSPNLSPGRKERKKNF